jgi:alkyl sulfatase BDS1-like metallo-beta-lactamase superfamily hydrolase
MDLSSLHPRRVASEIARRASGTAPDGVVEELAALVRRAPPERLDRIMRSPARRVVLDAIFWQMPRRLDQRRATGIDASIRWRITAAEGNRADVYDLLIADGRAHVRRGGGDVAPRLTISVDAAELVRVAVGSSNPVNAYFNGKLSLRGDVMQAARLTMLFRVPGGGSEPRPAP